MKLRFKPLNEYVDINDADWLPYVEEDSDDSFKEITKSLTSYKKKVDATVKLQNLFADTFKEWVGEMNKRVELQKEKVEQLLDLLPKSLELIKKLDEDYTGLVEKTAKGETEFRHGVIEELVDLPAFRTLSKHTEQVIALEDAIDVLAEESVELPYLDDESGPKSARKAAKKSQKITSAMENIYLTLDEGSQQNILKGALKYYSDVETFEENVDEKKAELDLDDEDEGFEEELDADEDEYVDDSLGFEPKR